MSVQIKQDLNRVLSPRLSNLTCQPTPHIRTCYDGVKPASKGGNPLGCGFEYSQAGGGVVRALSCKSPADTCLGVVGDGEDAYLVLVGCESASAIGWRVHNATVTSQLD